MSVVQNTTTSMPNFVVKDFHHSIVPFDFLELFDSTRKILDWSLTKFQDPNDTYTCIFS